MATFASYGGVSCFGRDVTMRTLTNPPAEQINEFVGASGYESLFLGLRGRVTEVEGTLTGTVAAALKSAELLLDSYVDGIGRVLVDTYGYSYASVRFIAYIPSGRVMNSGSAYFRRYRAILHHNT